MKIKLTILLIQRNVSIPNIHTIPFITQLIYFLTTFSSYSPFCYHGFTSYDYFYFDGVYAIHSIYPIKINIDGAFNFFSSKSLA